MFAAIAGLAGAVAIYFVSEGIKSSSSHKYLADGY